MYFIFIKVFRLFEDCMKLEKYGVYQNSLGYMIKKIF